eukprot:Protomagalhaensia_sp_Gyna_25__420@NODE_119_length_5103_cov_179_393167_g93_i0_p4_GENE_NODE_119_length_5103_cov_179_393167_g93_i0NODE_119_length_5103_cov_179_393167_g93_i0_p4_ORF_typecomplete_len208_score21_46Ribosomal_L13/PF00572_18/3e21Spc110_C/PF18520_1/0_12Spc110_C/PF18520_1/8_5e02HlyD_D23/PF16576_5/2_4_NODE_119_length_5103_cov_179_393167_g93_i043865009
MSSVTRKHILVDGKGHLAGRLGCLVAKHLLEGHKVTVVRCEDLVISGAMHRNHMKYMNFLRKRSNTNPRKHSHIHYRAPSMIFKRSVRGKLPHKTKRGESAYRHLVTYEGVPEKLETKKKLVAPAALACIRLKRDMPRTRMGDLAAKIGYKYGDVVARLEAKRKQRAEARYLEAKKQGDELSAKREAAIANAPAKIKEALALLTRED